jgi:hypothetical protein
MRRDSKRDRQRIADLMTGPEAAGTPARREATVGRDRDSAASLPNLPDLSITRLDIPDLDISDGLPDLGQWPTTDKDATAPCLEANKRAMHSGDRPAIAATDEPAMPAIDKPVTTVARPFWRLEEQLAARRRAMADAPGPPALALDERSARPPTDEPATTAVWRWLKIGSIAASLVVAAAGWWLYLGGTHAGDDLAQVEQALRQERVKTEELARELGAARADKELLAQERARNRTLEEQLAAQRDATRRAASP